MLRRMKAKHCVAIIGIVASTSSMSAVELVGEDESSVTSIDLPQSFQSLPTRVDTLVSEETVRTTQILAPDDFKAAEDKALKYPPITESENRVEVPNDWRLKRKVRQASLPQLVHNFKPSRSDQEYTALKLNIDTSTASAVVVKHQQLLYPQLLTDSYARNGQQSLWSGSELANQALNELQWQLFELSLAGADPQFSTWLALSRSSTDLEHLERIASDASLGLSHYYQQLQAAPYASQMSLQALRDVRFDAPSIGLSLPETSAAMLSQLHEQAILSNQVTQRFRSEISRLIEDHVAESWPRIDTKPMLKPGADDSRIVLIREQLARLGFEASDVQMGSYYDKELSLQVRQFQREHGLKEDGVIGPQTIRWLNRSPLYRARIVARNQLRMQLFGTIDPLVDQALLVNLPGYELEYVSPVQDDFRSRVIVGRESRQTPLLKGQISSIVLNPPWHVPSTLVEKDLLPKVRHNPNYIVDKHYELLSYDGKKVAPQSVDIEALKERGEFPYRMRQRPGPWNALGAFKFHFDNNQAIFLHDTSSPRLFNKDQRNLSSGCIRVEQADLLAGLLLEQRGIRAKRKDEYLMSGDTKWLSLKQTTPVYFLYLTAWIDEQSNITYRDDIYLYDNDLSYSSELSQLIIGFQSASVTSDKVNKVDF
ncbi:hypothetical protein DBZ36_09305 [Alginatibacterium sediminis]|uniref:L,D-TPase catalytic domain-containing protein n=1 Tax=Alginatibacterium sediminis TaxID=2164068 RepID=A0A420ED85_9ALTE|nr:L,D-transpeptidase family protein [Alginatibacterium sediminis]RKF18592.1 hypothetical protein DBZ36_09305 [Alginatibacterium sediminis]